MVNFQGAKFGDDEDQDAIAMQILATAKCAAGCVLPSGRQVGPEEFKALQAPYKRKQAAELHRQAAELERQADIDEEAWRVYKL